MCFEDGPEHALACGHRFHATCVENWIVARGTCPLCRAAVRMSAGHGCHVTRVLYEPASWPLLLLATALLASLSLSEDSHWRAALGFYAAFVFATAYALCFTRWVPIEWPDDVPWPAAL